MTVAVAAWLLDRQQTPVQNPGKKKKWNTDMAGSYSISDNKADMAADDAMMEEEEEIEEEGADNDLGNLIAECATGDNPASPVAMVVGAETAVAAAATANTSVFWRHIFPSSFDAKRVVVVAEKNDNEGPKVRHAVVNATSQAKCVGLQSSHAKLLQVTIDCPDWEQSRWTDGECVFGELMSRCGLDSFENTAGGGRGGATMSQGGKAGGKGRIRDRSCTQG